MKEYDALIIGLAKVVRHLQESWRHRENALHWWKNQIRCMEVPVLM